MANIIFKVGSLTFKAGSIIFTNIYPHDFVFIEIVSLGDPNYDGISDYLVTTSAEAYDALILELDPDDYSLGEYLQVYDENTYWYIFQVVNI